MDLKTYLFLNDLTVVTFAKKLDIAPTYLSAIKNGRKLPGRKLAKMIREATNGTITLRTKKEMAA